MSVPDPFSKCCVLPVPYRVLNIMAFTRLSPDTKKRLLGTEKQHRGFGSSGQKEC
jgi:hypothetical protein